MKSLHFIYLMSILAGILLMIALFSSCSKEDNQKVVIPQENIEMAVSFDALLTSGNWRLEDYYAKDPIDVDTNNTLETDLKPYISAHLSDDEYLFAGAEATVKQGVLKLQGIPEESFNKPYHSKADESGVEWLFLSHKYLPLKYRLESFSQNEFLVSVPYMGTTVFSKYKRL